MADSAEDLDAHALRIIEAGCGTGQHAQPIAKVIVVDPGHDNAPSFRYRAPGPIILHKNQSVITFRAPDYA
jgi:hypothetical protein